MPIPFHARRRHGGVFAVLAAALSAGLLTTATTASRAAGEAMVTVPAVTETTPSDRPNDSVDDMAVWLNEDDPAKSLVIGADHQEHSIDVYDLTGKRIGQTPAANANNVDLRTGFPLGGVPVPLVALAGDGEIDLYRFDPSTAHLTNVTVGGSVIYPGAHGVCLYRSATSGKFYVFAVNRGGTVGQFELRDEAGKIAAQKVRDIDVHAKPPADANGNDALEGCAADDRSGSLFVGEQDWYIWRYGAEPADGEARVKVDSDVSEGGHFHRDVEGLTVVNSPAGDFLIGSSQGEKVDGKYGTFVVYQARAPYGFVRKVKVVGSSTSDGCERTDGIDALAANLGPSFPQGIFICQDNDNTAPAPGNMNFKYARLEAILPLGDAQTPPTAQPPGDQPSPTPPDSTPPTGPPGASQPNGAGPSGHQTSGYWMLGSTGKVYAFGDAAQHGELAESRRAVDLEATPSGRGYWIADSAGAVRSFGDAAVLGDLGAGRLGAGEEVTSLSATPTGKGYWLFTNQGRAVAFGDASVLGDMSAVRLNGPVLDSIATPSGRGYYMVASDGGIFSFGDARFFGSMGDQPLNAPVQSLVPDPDDTGYWLVASDGGVFAFESEFGGSMGATRLNAPVTGMVPYGDGYLMVATDGGIFNFSDRPFAGSLGGTPPADPITSVAALR